MNRRVITTVIRNAPSWDYTIWVYENGVLIEKTTYKPYGWLWENFE